MIQLTHHDRPLNADHEKLVKVEQALKSDDLKDIQKNSKFENSSDPYIQENQEDKEAGKNGNIGYPSSPNNQNPKSSTEDLHLEDFNQELSGDTVHLKNKSSRVVQLKEACQGH